MSNISLQRLLVKNLISRILINKKLGIKISNDNNIFKFHPILFLKCILLVIDLINIYKIYNFFFKPVVMFKHSSLQLLNDYKTSEVFVLSRVNHYKISDVLNEFKDQNTYNYYVIHVALKIVARLSHIFPNKKIKKDLYQENILTVDTYKKARYSIATAYLKYYFFLCLAFLFNRKQIVIREEAHYQHSFLINSWFKMKNILVCEPQHGLIYKSHDAYNFSSAELKSGIAKYLPDVLFIFGNYWHNKLNSPAEKVILGKEFRNLNKIEREVNNTRLKRALIISDGLNFEFFLNLALNFRSVMGQDYTVLLRPHPSERQGLKQSSILLAKKNSIAIDWGDLDDSLSSSDYVISEMSTILYESMFYACNILMVYSEASKFVFGYTESDILHVIGEVKLLDFKSIVDCDLHDIYSPDFAQAYNNFLKDNLYVWNS